MGSVLLLYDVPPFDLGLSVLPLMATSMAEREWGALLLGRWPPIPRPGLKLSGVTDRRSPEELCLKDRNFLVNIKRDPLSTIHILTSILDGRKVLITTKSMDLISPCKYYIELINL